MSWPVSKAFEISMKTSNAKQSLLKALVISTVNLT